MARAHTLLSRREKCGLGASKPRSFKLLCVSLYLGVLGFWGNELPSFREVEVQPQVEPFLLHLFIVLLLVCIGDELRFNVRDQVDIMVLAEAGLLRRVVHLLLFLLRHELV